MKRVFTSLVLLIVFTFSFIQPTVAGEVSRAQFTSAIEQREPVDEITILSNDISKLYFFSELRDLQGQTVTHRWQFAGEVMAEISFNVGGPRWRVNSSKALMPGWIGDWTVLVIDGDSNIVAEYSFQYIEAEE